MFRKSRAHNGILTFSFHFQPCMELELESKMKMISKSAGYLRTFSNSSLSQGRLICPVSEQGTSSCFQEHPNHSVTNRGDLKRGYSQGELSFPHVRERFMLLLKFLRKRLAHTGQSWQQPLWNNLMHL